jgi:hypothetical protein
MALTTGMPLTTLPKTTCLPSSHAVLAVQRKNWEGGEGEGGGLYGGREDSLGGGVRVGSGGSEPYPSAVARALSPML